MPNAGLLLERLFCLAVVLILLGGCNTRQNAGPSPPVPNAATPPAEQAKSSELTAPSSVTTAASEAADKVSPSQAEEPTPLFAGWPKPTVALVLTGQHLGYIEPCGCSGLENQKGGLARRHTFIKQLADERG
jgi:hypothetical protein